MTNQVINKVIPKTKMGLIIWLGIILLAGFSIIGVYSMQSSGGIYSVSNSNDYQKTCLNLNNQCVVEMEIADTNQKRIKGLSNRKSLGSDKGMVFIFEQEEELCFWMKDTLIPLDMIWLNKNKKVTKIKKNVQPETYPNSFCSIDKDKYVIELNANKSSGLGIEVGQTLEF